MPLRHNWKVVQNKNKKIYPLDDFVVVNNNNKLYLYSLGFTRYYIVIKLEYWLSGITIGAIKARQPVEISINHQFLFPLWGIGRGVVVYN